MDVQSHVFTFEPSALEVIIRHFIRDLNTPRSQVSHSFVTLPLAYDASNSRRPYTNELTNGSYSSSININSANVLSFRANSSARLVLVGSAPPLPLAPAALVPAVAAAYGWYG